MKILKLLLLLLLCTHIYGDDIDALLDNIEKRSDLSEKTKLENSGVLFIWTRDDLKRMQITKLKEILKTVYPFGYDENRYGLSDPLTSHTVHPSMSANIRLYIDNQEITTGLYGSGLVLMGDFNIDWVDHIEIYTQNPTYEYVTESTVTLIKLYSKSVAKDEGSKIKIAGGSYGKKYIDAYHAGWAGDWSYFLYGYSGDDKRQKYQNAQSTLSRDAKSYALIATLHKGKTNILLDTMKQHRDGFMNVSIDATPQKSRLHSDYFHLGIDSKIDDFFYLFTFSYTRIHSDMQDDAVAIQSPPFFGLFPIVSVANYTHDYVFTAEIKHKKRFKNDTLLSGIKYRTKHAYWDKSTINGVDMLQMSNNKNIQNIASFFVENQYLFTPSSMFTVGVEYQNIKNVDTPQNDNLWMYRFSYTFTTQNWTLKTFYAHMLTSLEPYLIGSTTFLSDPNSYHKPQQVDSIIEDIIYKKEANRFELILDYAQSKDAYLPNSEQKISNYKKKLILMGINGRWTREYNQNDKLFLSASFRKIKNIPFGSGSFNEYKTVVRNINTYKRFDIFNELIYTRESQTKENFFNYSLGTRYRYNKDITFALKGVNLFDDAHKSIYTRIDPTTLRPKKPLLISPIDTEVLFSMSWVF